MFKFLVIAFIIFLIYSNIKNSKVSKKQKKKPSYALKRGEKTTYSYSKYEFYNTLGTRYLEALFKNQYAENIPPNLDFFEITKQSLSFESVTEDGEKKVAIMQKGVLLGYVKKGSLAEKTFLEDEGKCDFLGKLVYLDAQERTIKYYMESYAEISEAKLVESKIVPVVNITSRKTDQYTPSRKEAMMDKRFLDDCIIEGKPFASKYLLYNSCFEELGNILDDDLEETSLRLWNEEDYFYKASIVCYDGVSAQLEILIYEKKKYIFEDGRNV